MGSLIILASAQLAAAASYPADFPWENEVYTPAAMPDTAPDFSYVPESDPGGYYNLRNTVNFDNCFGSDAPGSDAAGHPDICDQMGYSRFLEYVLSAVWGYPPQLDLATWNCSAATPLQ